MRQYKEFRGVLLFAFLSMLWSWPILFLVNLRLVPGFLDQENIAAASLTQLFGHMLAMIGPALAALVMWRWYHKQAPPPWKWSRPRYYLYAVVAMLALWTIPALLGLAFGDALTIRTPFGPFRWTLIAAMLTAGWLAGIGEETGWSAYLMTRLPPHTGQSRAIVIGGAIRGLWHWPLLISPVIVQFSQGESSALQLIVLAVAFAFQLLLSNVFFQALFGWLWFKTESLPLVGWLHQWFDTARDGSQQVVAGFGGSLWVTTLWAFPLYLVALMLLYIVARKEGANMYSLAPPAKDEPDRSNNSHGTG
jgi:membrane protease YdiL (CAAX protease family)